MENNNTPQPNQPISPMPEVKPVASGGNKPMAWFIGGLVVIILVIGGLYWYMSSKQTAPVNTEQTTAPAKTTAVPTTNLDQDLNSIDVQASDDADFAPVNQDLKKL